MEKGYVFWRIFVGVVVLKVPVEDGGIESSSWRENAGSALRDNCVERQAVILRER